ncbi:MAG: RNA polymerase sporulation sigma factor SigK [Hespellia sp.]|nr:RNA polymerase sporulation sigma factor SigK [Hespellia sp.]
MKSFPPPLNASEEKIYLKKYSEGDLHAKQLLIEHNLRLVAHVIKKYQFLDEAPEDLISIGTIGLIKAIATFDLSKGNRLAAYAARCIENEILMMLRSKKKISKEVSLYEPIGTDREGNDIRLYDVIESQDEEAFSKISLKDNIQKLYKKVETELTPRERMILVMRYGLYNGEEHTQREIASHLGISRSYVSRIEKSAIGKLRIYFS